MQDKPKHRPSHKLHFTGRGNRTDGAASNIGANGDVKETKYGSWNWEYYWHCEQCEWYFVEYQISRGKFRPYTEAYKCDLDIMCKGCTTGNKTILPQYERVSLVDL